jgi:hypothetical protein
MHAVGKWGAEVCIQMHAKDSGKKIPAANGLPGGVVGDGREIRRYIGRTKDFITYLIL